VRNERARSSKRREEGANKEEAKEELKKKAADWQAVNPQLLLLAERDEGTANRALLLRDVG
jgi:hypothetical protein